MSLFELAKQFVCSVIAVAMGLTVSVVKGLLPLRADWLERVELLEAYFRRIAAGDETAQPNEAPPPHHNSSQTAFPFGEIDGFLAAYERLWEFTQTLRNDQFFLDKELSERAQKEWSVETLLAYMRAAERSLNDKATRVQLEASELISAARQHGSGSA